MIRKALSMVCITVCIFTMVACGYQPTEPSKRFSPLTLSPSSHTMGTGQSVDFTASGGGGRYSFDVVVEGGIVPSQGVIDFDLVPLGENKVRFTVHRLRSSNIATVAVRVRYFDSLLNQAYVTESSIVITP